MTEDLSSYFSEKRKAQYAKYRKTLEDICLKCGKSHPQNRYSICMACRIGTCQRCGASFDRKNLQTSLCATHRASRNNSVYSKEYL